MADTSPRRSFLGCRALLVAQLAIAGCGSLASAPPGSPVSPGAPVSGAPVQDVRAPIGEPFDLRDGQSAAVGSDGLVIRFERVTVDARCPTGDTCAQPGDAVVRIVAEAPSAGAATLDLHTDPQAGPDGAYQRYRIKVVKLEPRPVGEQPTPLPHYTATFVVSR